MGTFVKKIKGPREKENTLGTKLPRSGGPKAPPLPLRGHFVSWWSVDHLMADLEQTFPVQQVAEAFGAVPLDDPLPPCQLTEACHVLQQVNHKPHNQRRRGLHSTPTNMCFSNYIRETNERKKKPPPKNYPAIVTPAMVCRSH